MRKKKEEAGGFAALSGNSNKGHEERSESHSVGSSSCVAAKRML